MTTYETILVEQRDRVGIITLNRPKVLNALNQKLTEELLAAAETFDRDPAIGCIVITGSEKAFAAGADINEMQDQSFIDMYASDWFSVWDRLAAVRTPLVAAVAFAGDSYPTRPIRLVVGFGARGQEGASAEKNC